MVTLLKKEFSSFLSSVTGYAVLIVFLAVMGLLLWVLPGTDFNILESGYANLDALFILAPWIFMFLVPAITMKSFAEEKKSGTIEFLMTKPLSDFKIVLAKFLASFLLILFSLVPTLVYFITVYKLASPSGNIDTGGIWGSYLGLLFLGAGFVSAGVFASSVTENQVLSFILALLLCFLLYTGFDYAGHAVSGGAFGNLLVQMGISSHYSSISRGVVDTRDVIYFLSLCFFFIIMTRFVLEKRKW